MVMMKTFKIGSLVLAIGIYWRAIILLGVTSPSQGSATVWFLFVLCICWKESTIVYFLRAITNIKYILLGMLCLRSSQLVIVLCCVRLCMLCFLFGSVYV